MLKLNTGGNFTGLFKVSVVENLPMMFGQSQAGYPFKVASESSLKGVEMDARVNIKNREQLEAMLSSDPRLRTVLEGLPSALDRFLTGHLLAIEISVNREESEILYRLAVNRSDSQTSDPWKNRIQDSSILDRFDSEFWLDIWCKLSKSVIVSVW
jgi:hypothetical protein